MNEKFTLACYALGLAGSFATGYFVRGFPEVYRQDVNQDRREDVIVRQEGVGTTLYLGMPDGSFRSFDRQNFERLAKAVKESNGSTLTSRVNEELVKIEHECTDISNSLENMK